MNSKKHGFNDMIPKEWALHSKSVWTSREVSSQRNPHHKLHGATFPAALAERLIKMYSRKNDLIMDPFLGVGSTLIASDNLKRKGIGFEIYRQFAEISRKLTDGRVVNTDCKNLKRYVKDNTVQLTLTSPPYADFIKKSILDRKITHKTSKLVSDNNSVIKQYGENPHDLGNLGYDDFLEQVGLIMKKIYDVTRVGGYNIWVVKDHRNTKQRIPYIPVHMDIARAGEQAGFTFHDMIVWDQNDQRSLVLLGYPTVFYVNINHTFLVVMRKRS